MGHRWRGSRQGGTVHIDDEVICSEGLLMNAVVNHSVVLKDVRRTLSADTLKHSGECDFIISEEGPGTCEGIDFDLHWGPI